MTTTMTAETTAVTAAAPGEPRMTHWDTDLCSRCGGTGSYSYTWKWGYTCFRCGTQPHVPGSGWMLTKAGSAAREAWLEANRKRVRADEVRAGDVVVENTGRRWRVGFVEHAEPGKDFGRGSSDGGGTWTHYTVAIGRGDPGNVYRAVHAPDATVTLWTGEVAPPPLALSGTKRAREMREYIKAVAS